MVTKAGAAPNVANVSSYAEWVREHRQSKGWSVPELADKSGVTMPSIYAIESGKTENPQKKTLDRLEKVFVAKVPAGLKEQATKEQEIYGIGPLQDFDPHLEYDLPDCKGVYVFYDISDRPVYVGKAVASDRTIKKRIVEHADKFWFKRPIVEYAAYIKVDDEKLCSQLEQMLIKFLKSNAVLNKQGVDR